MSVIQSFSELESRKRIIELAHDHPALPRVVGIDVGQTNLALWLGMPRTDGQRADSFSSIHFRWLGWAIIHCSSTRTSREACALVLRGLEPYRRSMFALASTVVIEKQHRKNPRMRAIAAAIRRWVREKVPHGARMQIVDREAMHKFSNISGMPCPMPREYTDRKNASFTVVQHQTRQYAGQRWWHFLRSHLACSDDLADAALIAQDWMISRCLVSLVATHALHPVSAVLVERRNRNTWRRKSPRPAKRLSKMMTYDDYTDSDHSDDSDSDGARRVVRFDGSRKRRSIALTDKPLTLGGDDRDSRDDDVSLDCFAHADDDDVADHDDDDQNQLRRSLFEALQQTCQ